MSVGSIAVRQLGIPGRAAEDADTNAVQLAVHQILFCIQLHGCLLACFENNLVCEIFVGIALKIVGIEAHLDVVYPVATQGINLHIQYHIGFCFRTDSAVKGNLMGIVAEAVRDHDCAIGKGCLTGIIGFGITGVLGAAEHFKTTQVKSLVLSALQTDIGEGNGVSVGGIAVRQLCIPGRAAKDAKTDTGQLAVHQILFCIQLYGCLLACFENDLVSEIVVGIALKIVGIEAHLDVVYPVATQGVDLQIHIKICSVFGLFTIQCELVTVVAEAARNDDCAIVIAGNAGAIGIGKAGAVFTACPGSCAQIQAVIPLTCDPQVGDFQGVSVGCITVGQLGIPGRTAINHQTEAGHFSVFQEIVQTNFDGCFDTCLNGDSVITVIDAAFIRMGIQTNFDFLIPISTKRGHLQIHRQERAFRHGSDIADVHTLFRTQEHNGLPIAILITGNFVQEDLDFRPFAGLVNSLNFGLIVPLGIEALINHFIRCRRAVVDAVTHDFKYNGFCIGITQDVFNVIPAEQKCSAIIFRLIEIGQMECI